MVTTRATFIPMKGRVLTIQEWEEVARQAQFRPAKMAALCCISERHLQRLFDRHVHCTPGRWLRDLRCRLAKQLIAQGYTNKAVAAELNFASQSHFCREFKRVFGSSPQTFAPAHSNSGAPYTPKLSEESWAVLQSQAGPE